VWHSVLDVPIVVVSRAPGNLFQPRTPGREAAAHPSTPPTRQKPRPRRQKQKQVHLSSADVDRLIELYLAGKEINDLAREFEISRTTVMKHVERAGAPRRRGVIVEHFDEARKLYEQGERLLLACRLVGRLVLVASQQLPRCDIE
jgi:hypothetical protein